MQPSLRFGLSAIFAALLTGLTYGANSTPEQQAWGILEAGVSEKSFSKRSEAVHVLGLLPDDSRAVAMAEKALADPAPEVRNAAATALGQMHSHASFLKLEQALDDKDFSVVLAAAHSLWILEDKRAFEVYYEILLGERKTGQGLIADQEKMLRDRKKLAEFGFEEGIGFVPFASMGWEVVKTIHKDDVSPVRAAAAKVLADDPDPHSGQALVRVCSDKSWVVRAAALDAIARRGDPTLRKDIEPDLSDPKDLVRYTAAAAMIRLSDEARKAPPPPEKQDPPAKPRQAGANRGKRGP